MASRKLKPGDRVLVNFRGMIFPGTVTVWEGDHGRVDVDYQFKGFIKNMYLNDEYIVADLSPFLLALYDLSAKPRTSI